MTARPGIRCAALALLLAAAGCSRLDEGQVRALTHGGDAEHGRRLMAEYGCGGCHTVPGVPGARGKVAPPLAGMAQRMYIGGVLENNPDNLISWIKDPPAVDSSTAMPKIGLTERQARDIAAYLYTLK